MAIFTGTDTFEAYIARCPPTHWPTLRGSYCCSEFLLSNRDSGRMTTNQKLSTAVIPALRGEKHGMIIATLMKFAHDRVARTVQVPDLSLRFLSLPYRALQSDPCLVITTFCNLGLRPREAMTAWTRGLVSLLGLEKLRYRLVEPDRLIFKRHVSAVRQYHQRRAGNLLVHLLRQRWVALIMIAHDNQRRHLDVG